MHTLLVVAVVGTLALAILLMMGAVGSLILGFRAYPAGALTRIGVGLGFVMFGTWLLALAHVPIPLSLLIEAIVAVGIGFFHARRAFRAPTNNSAPRIRERFLSAVPVVVAVLLSLIVTFPLLMGLSREGLVFGSTSLWNADIAYYTLSARSVLATGLGNVPQAQWIVSNLDLSVFTLEANSGASIFLSVLSPLQGVLGHMGNVALVVASAVEWLAFYYVAAMLASAAKISIPKFFVGIVATGAFIFGMNVQIIGQQFLAQLIGTAAAAAFIATLLVVWLERRRTVSLALALVAWAAIGVMTYATIWLPLIVIVSMTVFVLVVRSGISRNWAKNRYWFIVYGAGLVGISPLLVVQAQILITHSTGQFGWPMTGSNDFVSVLTAFDPHLRPRGWPQDIQVFSWFIAAMAILAAAIGAKNLDKRVRQLLVISLVGLFVLIAASGAAFGWGDYRNWKAESYVMPIVMLAVYSSLVFGFGRAIRWITSAFMLGIVLVSCASYYALTPVSTTRQMFDLADSEQLSAETKGVNLRLGGPFETMMVASMIPTSSTLTTAYWPPAVSLRTCSLVKNSDVLATLPGSTRLNADYFLAPWPADCSSSRLPAELDQFIQIESNVDQMTTMAKAAVFFGGWYPADPGGVWSAKEAALVIPNTTHTADAVGDTTTLRVFFTSQPDSGEVREVTFVSEVDEVTSIINSTGDQQYVDVRIPTRKVATVTLETPAVKLKTDYRRVGIFVTGLEVR